jgi:hypothetical protein
MGRNMKGEISLLKISIEVVLEQCLFCGKIAAGADLCEECLACLIKKILGNR